VASECFTKEMLTLLADGEIKGPEAQSMWAHLITCTSCQDQYQGLAERLPLLASQVWGASIACIALGPELPRFQHAALRNALSEKGFTLSPPESDTAWAAIEVSSNKLQGDAVDATRLARITRDLRAALPPTSRIGALVTVGRGRIGKQGPVGEVWEQMTSRKNYSKQAFIPGQVVLSSGVKERLAALQFRLEAVASDGAPSEFGWLLPAESRTPVSAAEGGWMSWGGLLTRLPLQALQLQLVQSHLNMQAEVATPLYTLNGPATLSPSRETPVHLESSATDFLRGDRPQSHRSWKLQQGQSLRIDYAVPASAEVQILLQRGEEWARQTPGSLLSIGTHSERELSVSCPETPEPVHVWLLAATGSAEGLSSVLQNLPPLSARLHDVPLVLGEQLLTLPKLGGFLLLDIGTITREG